MQSTKTAKQKKQPKRKSSDTIEKGKVAHSKEAPLLASFVAILMFAVFFAKEDIARLGMFLAMFLEKPEAWPLATEHDVVGALSHRAASRSARMLGA